MPHVQLKPPTSFVAATPVKAPSSLDIGTNAKEKPPKSEVRHSDTNHSTYVTKSDFPDPVYVTFTTPADVPVEDQAKLVEKAEDMDGVNPSAMDFAVVASVLLNKYVKYD
jgi:hypothetical protein